MSLKILLYLHCSSSPPINSLRAMKAETTWFSLLALNPYLTSSTNKSVSLQDIPRYMLTSTRQRNKSKPILYISISSKHNEPILHKWNCKWRRTRAKLFLFLAELYVQTVDSTSYSYISLLLGPLVFLKLI